MYKVYYEDKTIIFAGASGIPEGSPVLEALPGESVTVAKVLQNLENNKLLFIKATDASSSFDTFRAQFREVEAAGGVVTDCSGRLLMIFRNGRWDLPKGHLEHGESCALCAAREVEEECGIKIVKVGESLSATYHFYMLDGQWVLKRTNWFRMTGSGEPRPQVEEGITRAEWVELSKAAGYIKGAFASVREVFRDAYPGI